MTVRTFLHVGCGPQRQEHTTPGFASDAWREIRLDIDPATKPDIVGSMVHMPAVADGSMDAVFSSHNIEHLYAHEVPLALAEFHRVLKPDGFLFITCPDLQSVCQRVAADQLLEPAYVSAVGPIAPIDMLYGHRPPLARGNLFMAHRFGFTKRTLTDALLAAGFGGSAVMQVAATFALFAIATRRRQPAEVLHQLAREHFPQTKAGRRRVYRVTPPGSF